MLYVYIFYKDKYFLFAGYVRFLNDRREDVRAANPNLSFAEITKILASEWSSLPAAKKQQYLDAAGQDRERYTREYNAYKQTDAYKLFTQQQNEKKMKETKEETQVSSINDIIKNIVKHSSLYKKLSLSETLKTIMK